MLAQMYSVQELDRSVRTDFELPSDPYSDDPEVADKAGDYLRELGLFFYRDEENVRGIVLQPNNLEEVITEMSGFVAFKHLVQLDENDFTPLAWSKATPSIIEKNGDDRAWLHFNSKRYIETVSASAIKTGVIAS